jgi:hypothetical protein
MSHITLSSRLKESCTQTHSTVQASRSLFIPAASTTMTSSSLFRPCCCNTGHGGYAVADWLQRKLQVKWFSLSCGLACQGVPRVWSWCLHSPCQLNPHSISEACWPTRENCSSTLSYEGNQECSILGSCCLRDFVVISAKSCAD